MVWSIAAIQERRAKGVACFVHARARACVCICMHASKHGLNGSRNMGERVLGSISLKLGLIYICVHVLRYEYVRV